MKTFNSRLKVIYGSDDLSNSLSDFNLDTETITLADTEYIYISNLHRFNHVFVAVQTGNTIAAEMTVEAYANGEWSEVVFIDDSKAFTRNGFIMIDPNVEWPLEAYNGLEGYHLRLSVSVSTSEMILRAINILLSDDEELEKEYPPLATQADFKLGEPDFLGIHQSVRDFIIQKFRNRGIQPDSDRLLDAFQLVEIEDVKAAATYKALAKIFSNVSDNQDDTWSQKAMAYSKKGDELISSVIVRYQADGIKGQKSMKYAEVTR